MTDEQIIEYVEAHYSGLFTLRVRALLCEPYSTFKHHVRSSFEREAERVREQAQEQREEPNGI